MDRLTVNDLNKVCYDPWELCGMDSYCKKGCYEEGGCTKGCHILKMYRKLAEYEDLEEQGKLLKLPCAPGQPVWKIKNGKISKWVVGTIKIEEGVVSFCNAVYICDISDFGKTVFLTEEEAEAALKELERGKGK